MSETSDQGKNEQQGAPRRRLRLGLSGKLLLLTIVFVMVSEILIYVPSIANYRMTWLRDRLHTAYVAALVVDAAPDNMVPKDLQRELLATAGASAIVIKRDGIRRLLLASDMPPEIAAHYDLREQPAMMAIKDAFATLVSPMGRTIRVVGDMEQVRRGDFIEIVIDEGPLKKAMVTYSTNILTLSIIISVITAALVYVSLNWLLVRPMRRITRNMLLFRQKPEDAGRVMMPSARGDEIGVAEHELADMQRALSETINQKAHLAALGLAVSKISHDLRNMLATAQVISDRLANVPDPTVQRFVPKLVASLDRAIGLCTSTIRYGKVRELPADRRRLALQPLLEEVAESVGLAGHGTIVWNNQVAAGLEVDADPDQLFRVLMNLARNAVQALESYQQEEGAAARVTVRGAREGTIVSIDMIDNGPGVPARTRDHLFEAFRGAGRPGGTGLGLAIAAELIRAHGGQIDLVQSVSGSHFRLTIPDRVVELKSRRGRTTPAADAQSDAAG